LPITLPITIGNWYYSKIRVISNVVDSITKPPKTSYNYFLQWHTKNTNVFITQNTAFLVIQNAAFKSY